jgi:hypothetical protein
VECCAKLLQAPGSSNLAAPVFWPGCFGLRAAVADHSKRTRRECGDPASRSQASELAGRYLSIGSGAIEDRRALSVRKAFSGYFD